MNAKHTTEPWMIEGDLIVGPLGSGSDYEMNDGSGSRSIAAASENMGPRGKADLARIVACVNALAGIADPEAAIKAAENERAEAVRLNMAINQAGCILGDVIGDLNPGNGIKHLSAAQRRGMMDDIRRALDLLNGKK